MFLALVEGTLTAAARHETLTACRFLLARRLEGDGTAGDEPLIVLDRLGARRGSLVIVSTDGDIARGLFGAAVPARLTTVGLVDEVHLGRSAR